MSCYRPRPVNKNEEMDRFNHIAAHAALATAAAVTPELAFPPTYIVNTKYKARQRIVCAVPVLSHTAGPPVLLYGPSHGPSLQPIAVSSTLQYLDYLEARASSTAKRLCVPCRLEGKTYFGRAISFAYT